MIDMPSNDNTNANFLERVKCPFCGSDSAHSIRNIADIAECHNCGTVYLRTRLSDRTLAALCQLDPDEDSPLSIPESEDEIENSPLRRDSFLQEIIGFIDANGRLIDIGCAWAAFLDNARESGFETKGFEINKKSIEFAEKELHTDVSDIDFTEENIVEESVSVITMLRSLEHVLNPKATIEKIYTSLKPGGFFCGIVPNFGSFLSELMKDSWNWIDPYHHITHFTPESLTTHLESAGFITERMYTASGDFDYNILTGKIRSEFGLSDDEEILNKIEMLNDKGQGEEIHFFVRKPDVSDEQNISDEQININDNCVPEKISTTDLHERKPDMPERIIDINEKSDYEELLFDLFKTPGEPEKIILNDPHNKLPKHASDWNGIEITQKHNLESVETITESDHTTSFDVREDVTSKKSTPLNLPQGETLIESVGRKNIQDISLNPSLGGAGEVSLDKISENSDEEIHIIPMPEAVTMNEPENKKDNAPASSLFAGFDFEDPKDDKDSAKIVKSEDKIVTAPIPDHKDLIPSTKCDLDTTYTDGKKLNVVWEGSQFVFHSLALVNREHCVNLAECPAVELTVIPFEKENPAFLDNPKYDKLKLQDVRVKDVTDSPAANLPYVWIRHQWPPKITEPKGAKWIIMQPWEYSVLLKDLRDTAIAADEIWTPSNFSREAFIKSGVDFNKVQVIPNGVDPKIFTPVGDKYLIPTEKKLIFLFVGGTLYRKGIDILIEAYINAFTAEDNVCLFIKDMGGDSVYKGQTSKDRIQEIKQDPNAPEIQYYDEYMDDEQMPNLYRACDVFISPYRGEGFSLPTIEAMACGLPVIVTEGGATDDFVDDEVGWKIPAKPQSIGNYLEEFEFTEEAFVLEPDIKELILMMRSISENPEEIFSKGLKAAQRARTDWTWKRSTLKALTRLDALYGFDMAKESMCNLTEEKDDITRLADADDLFAQGRKDEALELFSKLSDSDNLNDNHRLYACSCETLIQLENKELHRAYTAIEKADSISNKHPDSTYLRAKIHAEKEQWIETFDLLSVLMDNWGYYKYKSMIGIRLDIILCDTGDAFLHSDDYENALQLYTQTLKINHNNAKACYGAAHCFMASDIYDEAKNMLEWAIKLDPSYTEAIDALKDIEEIE